MKQYRVNVGVTIIVEVDDPENAEEKAYEIAQAEWGSTFAREAWYSDPEEIE